MHSGFESLSTMAGEIRRPQYVIPRALMITLPVVLGFYVLSTMGRLAALGQFGRWATEGSSALDFMGVGREVGGQVLRYLFLAAMLIVVDVFLLMLAHITIYVSAVRLRVKEPDPSRPFRVPVGAAGLALMSAVPITVAVLAMSRFGSGWDYFIGGALAALTGPPAYFIFKRIYGGEKARTAAAGAAAAPVAGATAVSRPAAD
jgi:amino acid transporter